MKVIGDNLNSLDDYELGKKLEHQIELKELKENEKMSIISDSMFKTMFQNKNRMKYSAKLISYFIDIPYEKLLDKLKLTSNELDKEKITDKSERSDYVAEIDDDIINIEINNNNTIYTREKNLEYALRLYSGKVKTNKERESYKYTKVLQINFNNFYRKGLEEKPVRIYTMNDGSVKLTDKIIIVEISLPLLQEKCYNKGVKELTEMERAILTTYETNIEKSKELGKGIEVMEHYIDESVQVREDGSLGESYDHEVALMNSGYNSGVEKGIETGIEKRNIEIAKNLLKENIDINTIIKVTGLTKEEIENIE